MFRSLMAIIGELYLYLTKVIFMLKHSVKLRRYILDDVAACRRAACVLCAVQCVCIILYSTMADIRVASTCITSEQLNAYLSFGRNFVMVFMAKSDACLAFLFRSYSLKQMKVNAVLLCCVVL